MITDDGKGFGTPMGGFELHSAAFSPQFETGVARGYILAIGPGGRVEKHPEDYDRLLVALSDLSVQEVADGKEPTDVQMKKGEVRWFARGTTHATINVGNSPAALLTLEFK